MELRQLRSFIAVAEDGVISRAAQRLHLTQSALSRQIKALEEDLGVTLLERSAHSVKLTQEGEVLLKEGRGVLERADAAVTKVRAAGKAVLLRVGYAPTLTAGILPLAISAFTQKHPRVRVELLDLSSTEMRTGLDQGSLDVVMTVKPAKLDESIHWESLLQEAWCVAMSPNHPLNAKKSIAPAHLDGARMVLFSQQEYPEYWQRVTSWFKGHGMNALIAGEYDGANSLASAIEAGLGVALVVERMACSFPRLSLKPLKPEPEPVCIAAGVSAARRSDMILQVFVEELKRAAKESARRV
ncbi:MAG: LysR substrate-binding domain-containing protein [Verrucomicrobiaceae bacterium]|nr:LysR substrate-binding domain-containing protein [Verrucomicrobiaceae bacterium]